MTAPLTFSSFVGNRRVVEILRRALDFGRLPHALIFAGPDGVGKRSLALLLARRLNCVQPVNGEACDRCSSCRKIIHATHPDLQMIEPDGAFIKIDQLRSLINEIAYQPFEGRLRVAILNNADQMRVEAGNCLLKTLEEPPSRSILILVTAKPYALLGTIRSRARLIQFGLIEEREIEDYLIRHAGRNAEDARLAAALSNGSLGAALASDAAQTREMRTLALRFIALLLHRESFTHASALASGLPKDRESFQAWLEMVAILLQDVYYAQVAPARREHQDDEIQNLARSAAKASVIGAVKAVKNLKAALPFNVNRQLALEALFVAETACKGIKH
jgi:DNA polymerase-3 subunit delta'